MMKFLQTLIENKREKTEVKSRDYFRGLNRLYGWNIFGIVNFSGIVIYLTSEQSGFGPLGARFDRHNEVLVGVFAVMLVFFIGYVRYYRRRRAKLRKEKDFIERMSAYRVLMTKLIGGFEYPLSGCIILTFWTGDYWFLVPVAVGLAWLVFLWPTRSRTINGLELNSAERLILEEGKEIIAEI